MSTESSIWPCIVLGADYGGNADGIPTVQIHVRITEGPDTGKQVTYEDAVNAQSAKYIGYSAKAVGWKTDSLKSLKADATEWIAKTGGKSTVEIKPVEIKRGAKAGQIWNKPNSIGRGPRVLVEAKEKDLKDADDVMREFAPTTAGGGGGFNPDAPADEDSIPFVTINRNHLGAIAKVLR